MYLLTNILINLKDINTTSFEGCYDPCPPRPYCPPYYPPYCPPKNDDCVPNEKANDALRDFEILLVNWTSNLQSASKTAVDNAFTSLNTAVAGLNTKDSNDVKTLINKLEDDVLAVINQRLTVLQSNLEKLVTSEFTKLNATDAAILTAIRTQITTTVAAVAALPEADAAAIVKDTQFGLQSKIFSQLDSLLAQLAAAGVATENTIIFKLVHDVVTEEENIKTAITKLFKEFIKALKTSDAKYAAELKKLLDVARNKLESELASTFTSITQRDAYFLTAVVKKLIEYLTGCTTNNAVDTLPFLLGNALGTTNVTV